MRDTSCTRDKAIHNEGAESLFWWKKADSRGFTAGNDRTEGQVGDGRRGPVKGLVLFHVSKVRNCVSQDGIPPGLCEGRSTPMGTLLSFGDAGPAGSHQPSFQSLRA